MKGRYVHLAVLAIVLLLSPCPLHASVSPEERLFTYDFQGFRFDVRFIEGAVILYLPDGPLTLPQGLSASGARYTDGNTTFWIKGENAHLELDGSVVDEKPD